jgi:hypothetical protein
MGTSPHNSLKQRLRVATPAVNALWDRIELGYVGHHNAFCYVGKAEEKEVIGEEPIQTIVPILAKDLQDQLN